MVTVTCSFFLNYFQLEWDVTYQMNIVDYLSMFSVIFMVAFHSFFICIFTSLLFGGNKV